MAGAVGELWRALIDYVDARGVAVREAEMDLETPAEFDGLTITVNHRHDREPLCWYLVHSFGSIVGWSLDLEGTAAMFHELRDAKCSRHEDPARLERAIARFRRFEEAASSYSVWTLDHLGHAWAIPPFTLFFRADLEAITEFHREGVAPKWPPFLKQWQDDVASGARPLVPFEPRAVPPFRPVSFERQEVKQER